MTQAEHRRLKSILDDRAIYEWILNAKIRPLEKTNGAGATDDDDDGPAQMAPLRTPQFLFGRGFGRVEHPDDGLVASNPITLPPPPTTTITVRLSAGDGIGGGGGGLKRMRAAGPDGDGDGGMADDGPNSTDAWQATPSKKPKRPKAAGGVRFAATPEPESVAP